MMVPPTVAPTPAAMLGRSTPRGPQKPRQEALARQRFRHSSMANPTLSRSLNFLSGNSFEALSDIDPDETLPAPPGPSRVFTRARATAEGVRLAPILEQPEPRRRDVQPEQSGT